MTPAVLLGTSLGKVVLGRFSEELFRRVFHALLLIMATKLVFYDGHSLDVDDVTARRPVVIGPCTPGCAD